MTDTADSSTETGVLDSYLLQDKHLIPYVVVVSVLGERLFTGLFWELESNPVVTGLGFEDWVLFTAAVLLSYLYTWYGLGGYKLLSGKIVSAVLIGIHVLAILTNALYVIAIQF